MGGKAPPGKAKFMSGGVFLFHFNKNSLFEHLKSTKSSRILHFYCPKIRLVSYQGKNKKRFCS